MQSTHTQAAIVLTPELSLMVDELGFLQSQADTLKIQIDTLKTAIKGHGAGKHMGSRFQSLVSPVAGSAKIDWQAVAEHFSPSRQLITAHTTHTPETLRIVTTLQRGKA